jgi:hypothetical protein
VAWPGYEKIELFDLEKDLSEKQNLASQFPERTEEMKRQLQKWEESMLTFLPYTTELRNQ